MHQVSKYPFWTIAIVSDVVTKHFFFNGGLAPFLHAGTGAKLKCYEAAIQGIIQRSFSLSNKDCFFRPYTYWQAPFFALLCCQPKKKKKSSERLDFTTSNLSRHRLEWGSDVLVSCHTLSMLEGLNLKEILTSPRKSNLKARAHSVSDLKERRGGREGGGGEQQQWSDAGG